MDRHPSAITLPSPTPILFVIAAVLAWSFSADVPGVFGQSLAVLILATGVGGLVWLVARHPVLAVTALIASGAMARLYVEVFHLNVRPEHMAVLLCCLALPFCRPHTWPQWTRIDLLLALYVAVNLLSSLFMSVAPSKTLIWAAQQSLVILPFFLLRFFCRDRRRFRRAVDILLIVGATQAAIGVFCFLCNVLFGTVFGMEIGQYGDIPGTFGVAYEANILAAISAATCVMAMAMFLIERRRMQLWIMVLAYAGLLVALSRAAVGAVFITVVLLLALFIWTRTLDWTALKTVAKALVAVALLLLPAIAPLYLDRFSTIEVSDVAADPDTLGRVVVLVTAVDGIMAHPLLGNGTSSFQLLADSEQLGFGEKGAWIGNTEMRILHDTGLIGLGLFMSVVASLAWRALRILKRRPNPELMALLLGCAVYGITFQATEGTLMEFFWVQLGLLACAVFLNEQSPDAVAMLVSMEPLAGGSPA